MTTCSLPVGALFTKTHMPRVKSTPKQVKLFTCVVCTVEKAEARHAATLACHPGQVCKLCLRTWFNQSHTCPVCRAEVTSHEAVSGSAADFERALQRQERRRERQRRAQMQYDARMARDMMRMEALQAEYDARMVRDVLVRDWTGASNLPPIVGIRQVGESHGEQVFVVEFDIDQINW